MQRFALLVALVLFVPSEAAACLNGMREASVSAGGGLPAVWFLALLVHLATARLLPRLLLFRLGGLVATVGAVTPFALLAGLEVNGTNAFLALVVALGVAITTVFHLWQASSRLAENELAKSLGHFE